jgi:hypothetical protein
MDGRPRATPNDGYHPPLRDGLTIEAMTTNTLAQIKQVEGKEAQIEKLMIDSKHL